MPDTERKSLLTFPRDLRLQVLVFYLIFVGLVAAAAIIFNLLASERLRRDVEAADLALAQAIALETDAILLNAIHTVEALAQQPAVINGDLAAMNALFGNLAHGRSDINLIYRLDSDGIMRFHYPVEPGSTVGVDFSFREYFQDALRANQAVISKGRISPTTNQAVATTVMPIRKDPEGFLGVVATNIRLTTLSETLTSIAAEHRAEDDFVILIIDSAGQVIASPEPEGLLALYAEEAPEIVAAVQSGASGALVRTGSDGIERLESYVPIESAVWGVIVRRPTAVAFGTARAFQRGLLIAITVFLGAGLVFWVVLSRTLIQPLEDLAQFSLSLGSSPETEDLIEADISHISQRQDQIGHLSRSLKRMWASIQQRLTEQETLLETSKAVLSTLRPEDVLDRILEQTGLLLQADRSAIVAYDENSNTFRVRASRGLSEHYISRLKIDPDESASVTMRALASARPYHIADTEAGQTSERLRLRAREEGYRGVLSVPLLAKHTPPSALLVYFSEPRALSEREINLVLNFANHAAMAIENAALYARSDQRLQETTQRLDALIQSMGEGLILEDLEGRVLYYNRRVNELTGLSPEMIEHLSATEVRQRLLERSNDADHQFHLLEEAIRSRGPQTVEVTLSSELAARVLRFQIFEVYSRSNQVIGHGQIIQDITSDREVDRMKTSLIATVSHELRTPLAAIKGYASTLLAEDVEWDPAAEREFLRVISEESDRLSALVTDLLDLSKIEGGSLEVTRSEWSLPELIEQAMRSSHPSPGDRLILELDPQLPMLWVDGRRIAAVFRNLLENASKYSAPDSPIVVRATCNDDHLLIQVEDQGPGIPDEFAQLIFEPFVKIDQGLARSRSGAGLGLSICRGFIRAHDGEIWLEPCQQGTCVSFTLPLGNETHG